MRLLARPVKAGFAKPMVNFEGSVGGGQKLICEYSSAPWLRGRFSCCFSSADSDCLFLDVNCLRTGWVLGAVSRLIKRPFYFPPASDWGTALQMPAALEALFIFPSSSLVGMQGWFLIYQQGEMGFLPPPQPVPF